MSSLKARRRLFAPYGIQVRDVYLTNAQLEALLGTVKTLVPAPQTGWHYVFLGADFRKPANSDAQTVPGNSELEVRYTNGAGLQVGQIEGTGFLDQASEQVRYMRVFKAASAASQITPVSGAALVLHMANADISAGDALLSVRIWYRRLPDVF